MKVREWAALEGFNPQTVWKWLREGTMPARVTVERSPSGAYMIYDPKHDNPAAISVSPGPARVVCYARVSSGDQKADLERQADRLKAFAIAMGVERPEVVTETGSGTDDRRRKINTILADPSVGVIIVERRDRLAVMNADLVESALEASGRKLIVVDDGEPGDSLVQDATGAFTSLCARLYGRRAAKRKAEAALRAARDA